MSEAITIFVAGALLGMVMTCIVVGPIVQRALNGWDKAKWRIEDLEDELAALRTEREQEEEEDWK